MATFHFYRGDTPAVPLGTLLKLDGDVVTGRKSVEENFGEISSLELDLSRSLLPYSPPIADSNEGTARDSRVRSNCIFQSSIPAVSSVGPHHRKNIATVIE